MVDPVSNSGGVSALQRAQPTSAVSKASPIKTSAVSRRASDVPSQLKNIDLASANAQPNSNLPRGSIVDKLV